MKNPIKTFEANTAGRDFVIGDLHGALSVLVNLLASLKFDPLVDRVFSVGDLVDRGPDSLGCLELLKEPWFHSVLANHEQMMLEAFDGGYMGQFWFRNGGIWGIEALKNFEDFVQDKHLEVGARQLTETTKTFLSLIDIVRELPFLITVNKTDGSKAHIIHAELPPRWAITDAMLTDPAEVVKMATVQSNDGDFFIWGRHKYYQFFREDLSNRAKNIRTVAYNHASEPRNEQLSHVISGHTIVHKPLTILGQTNLDTMAYGSYPEASKAQYGTASYRSSAPKWCALTAVELNTWKFYQATETEFREVEPEVINRADIDALKDNHG